MAEDAPRVTLESLREHAQFVRALARSLVRDEHLAEDLEQETWVAAMEGPPRRSVKGWLRSVVRNLSLNARRGRSRREARERTLPAPAPAPSAADLASRRETLRAVLDAVLALEEPYQSTVLLHFYEGLTPSEIAERLGVPAGTVRSRLHRALAMLRERLDGRHGGERRAWVLALLPISGRAPAVPAPPAPIHPSASGLPAATGALIMATAQVKAASVVAALVALGALGWWAMRPEPDPGPGAGGSSRTGTVPRGAGGPAVGEEGDGAGTGSVTPAYRTRIAIRVVDTAGRPVAGARAALAPVPFRVDSNPWGQRHHAASPGEGFGPAVVTGSDGRARLEGVPPGKQRLRVTAPGFAVHQEEIVAALDDEELSRLVVLLPSWTLEGVVFGPGGEPLPGVEVLAEVCAARTDRAGRYRLEGLPPGRHSLSVRTESSLFPDLAVVAVPGPRRLDLRLEGGAVLEGRVLDDATAAGIAGARLLFMVSTAAEGSGLRSSTHAGVTGDEGGFRIGGVPPWMPTMLEVRAEGYLLFSGWYTTLFPPHYRFAEGDRLGVEVRLRRGRVVRGRVALPDGAPVAGATVEVLRTRASGEADMATEGQTGADGRYSLLALPGTGLLRVRAPGLLQPGFPEDPWGALRSGDLPEACRVEVAEEGETIRDAVLEPVEPTAAGTAVIAGFVRSSDGEGLSAARVEASYPGGVRHAAPVLPGGVFRIEGLPPGDPSVTARAEGRVEARVAVEGLGDGEERTGIEIVLPPGRDLAGRVEDRSGGPVAGATVALDGGGPGGSGAPLIVGTTDADGRYAARGLPPLAFRLRFEAPGFLPATRSVGVDDDRMDAILERSLTISGVVVREGDEAPVEGLLVWADRTTSRSGAVEVREALTDGEGRFRIDDLDAVEYDLSTGRLADHGPAADFEPARVARVTAGEEGVRIVVRPGLSIAGKVVDGEGHPASSGTVDLNGPEGGTPVWKREAIAPDGTFRARGLPEGTYILQVQPGGGLAPVRLPRVAAGVKDLVVRCGDGPTIRGRILLEDGRPLTSGPGGFSLRWQHPDGSTTWTGLNVWDKDGSFRTGPLDPDLRYDIVFYGRPGFLGGAVRGVAPGTEDVVLTVRKGGTLEGRVEDEGGRPIAGIHVGAETWEIPSTFPPEPGRSMFAITDARGQFRLEGMAALPYEVHCGGDGTDYLYNRLEEPVVPGTSGIVLRLRRGSFLEGRIVDASGEPYPEGYLHSFHAGGDQGYCPVGRDGGFSLRGIPPGEYTLRLQIGKRYLDLGTATAPAADLVLRKPAE